jgi:hypothetical protein
VFHCFSDLLFLFSDLLFLFSDLLFLFSDLLFLFSDLLFLFSDLLFLFSDLLFPQEKGGHPDYSRVMCYSDLSRGDAEDILKGLPAGCYVVRPCSDKAGNKLSLSVV